MKDSFQKLIRVYLCLAIGVGSVFSVRVQAEYETGSAVTRSSLSNTVLNEIERAIDGRIATGCDSDPNQNLSGISVQTGTDTETISYNAELSFGDDSITETASGSGYSTDGTALTITANGVYHVSGSCSEGNIEIAKGLDEVTLVLDDLTLSSSSTAPIVVKKGTAATLHIEGTVTLTDDEDPDNETSEDTTVADAFEGASI